MKSFMRIRTPPFTVILLVCVAGVLSDDNSTVKFEACEKYTSGLDWKQDRLETLHLAFPLIVDGEHDPLDLIFLLDSSGSIRASAFVFIKSFISSMVQYLVEQRRLLIHPDDARLAAITFQEVPITEWEGIKYNPFDACSFEKRLDSIEREQSGQTEIDKALQISKTLFSNSEREARKMLWVFTDGEYKGDDEKMLKENVETLVQELKSLDVRIFSAGVGGGDMDGELNKAEEEENLQYLANDVSHYMCIQHWQELITDNRKGEDSSEISADDQPNGNRTLYAPAANENIEACNACGELGIRCVCDLLSQEYGCYDCNTKQDDERHDYICSVSATRSTSTTPSEQKEKKEDLDWLLYVIIGGSVAGGLIILIIVMCCICCLGRKKPRRTVDGPPLPPPPIPSRGRTHMIMSSDPEYGNTLDLQPRYDTIYGEQTQPVGEVNVDLEYDVAACERDMAGWSMHLNTLSREAGLQYLAVHSTVLTDGRRRWSTTPGFRVSSKEVKDLDSAFRHGADFLGGQIKVSGNMYTFDQKDISDLHMSGKRPRIVGGMTREEIICVAKTGNYLVVGVAEGGKEDGLQETVFSLYRHLVDIDGNQST